MENWVANNQNTIKGLEICRTQMQEDCEFKASLGNEPNDPVSK